MVLDGISKELAKEQVLAVICELNEGEIKELALEILKEI